MDILFDLDGTLTDPVVGITRCIQHALVNLGRTAPEIDSLRRCVGPPLQDSFAELLETTDEILLSEAIRLYRERFKPIGMFENSVYPDVPQGLETLRAQGQEGISPEQAWMVGDRMHDVLGARRNGVEAIGVLWGYGSEEELRAAAPRRIVATMAELCEAIQMERRPREAEAS